MIELLATKLHIPQIRQEYVLRPRLTEQLDEVLHRRLALISAAAGFGKTMLVSEWIASCKCPVAWLSLDKDDNEVVRFLAYIIAALQTIESTIGESLLDMLLSPHPPSVESAMTTLLNDIAAMPKDIVLVLDDYHLIESELIDDILTYLLAHLPSQIHIVIVTREDPQFSLARLRASGQLIELRGADIRFTSSECVQFLNEIMKLGLSAEDAKALETRTEGWIAGLQLAAISLQNQKDVSTFIQSFAGSHRHILDYLIEEVLEKQSGEIQSFLLRTSILKRLTGSLCNAVVDNYDGRVTLETLDRSNLFIIPLDTERRWYRYHHLFAELLYQRLLIIQPDILGELHSSAAKWYEANGYLDEAIHHAFASDDIEEVTRLIEKGSLAALDRSDFRFIFSYVERLPDDALEHAPWLFVYYTWALLVAGQLAESEQRLENTEWLLDAIAHRDNKTISWMRGYISGMKAMLCLWQHEHPMASNLANEALKQLPENHWMSGYCAMIKGAVGWDNGDLESSLSNFLQASAIGKVCGNKRVAVTSVMYLGHTLELQGRLHEAIALYRDAFSLTTEDDREIALAGYLHTEIGRVLYEINDLDRAYYHLNHGIELCQRLSDHRVEKMGHLLLARVHMATGDYEEAIDALQSGDNAHSGTGELYDMRGNEYPHIRLLIKQRKLQDIESWLNENKTPIHSIPNETYFKTKLTLTMRARAMIFLGQARSQSSYLSDAHNLLNHLLELAESKNWTRSLIEIYILQALAFQAQDDIESALETLEKALVLAKLCGFIRFFVDEGSSLARLLYEALSRDIEPDYTRQLLAAFPIVEEETEPPELRDDNSELIEPLSEREIEVLELMAEGLTNQDIGARLFLARNTVKVHIRHIYEKLGVHNRMQAVAIARSLGLLLTE